MKWIKQMDNARIPVKSWCGDADATALKQAANLAAHPALECHVALMPDCHAGFGMPIGGVIAARDAVLPAAVGVDIGCGMVAVGTDIPAERFRELPLRRALLEKLKARIPAGEGVAHPGPQEWDGFERYLSEPDPSPELPTKLDRANLGTLGGGNHFVELQQSGDGRIYLMLHSGSRNMGARVEERYQRLARKLNEKFHVVLPDPELAFLPVDIPEGQAYFRDMNFALAYALENRRRMMAVFRETIAEFVPEANFLDEVNIHHNYAVRERHGDAYYYIHRKGATSAKLDEIGIIPGSMGTASYIVRGLGNPESFQSCSHGAGRVMSRTEACKKLSAEECDRALAGVVYDRWKPLPQRNRSRLPKGTLDLSEAPQAYKAIDDVIAAELDLIEPLVRLTPLAVLKG